MKPAYWITAGAAAILVSCTNPKWASMTSMQPQLQVSALQATPAGDVHSLRLTPDGNGVHLASMAASSDGPHGVTFRALESGAPVIPSSLPKLASPFGTPFWDLSPGPGGFFAVWTVPGSANSKLGFLAPGKPEVSLTGHYPSGVFQYPRFVRGQPLAVTATALEPAGAALVLFLDGWESGKSPYRVLPAAGPGTLLDGLLIRLGKGYLLLARHASPGSGVAERTDLRGESVAPGVLRGLRLDSDFRPVDSVFSPLGDSLLFEFDADISGENLHLLATTAQGYKVAAAVMQVGDWLWFREQEIVLSPAALYSPTLLAQGPSATAAFLSVDGTGARKILQGRISIEKK